MMTIQETAKRLGKSESTIRRWIREGRITANKVHGVYDVPDDALNEYLSDYSDRGKMEAELRAEVVYLKERIRELEDARERADMINLQLVRQIETKALEDKRSWWQKLFHKR